MSVFSLSLSFEGRKSIYTVMFIVITHHDVHFYVCCIMTVVAKIDNIAEIDYSLVAPPNFQGAINMANKVGLPI